MTFKIDSLKRRAIKTIEKAQNLKDLDEAYRKYLGKKGKVSLLFNSIKRLSLKERKKVGKGLNELKKEIEGKIEKKMMVFSRKEKVKLLDITLPGEKISFGHLHPLSQVLQKCEEIFEKMGFSIIEGPEIENEWYNFDALNIPKDHPARDLWNTLWLKNNKDEKLLLRTHTSPVQVRYMERHNPPLRVIVPGRVFRYEATDPSHEIQFYQLEGLMVDKKISVANFKGMVQKFLGDFFDKDIPIRMRPGYFPFTEPSFEVDIKCIVCQGKGCSTCAKSGWIELIPGGMVHPNVFKAARLAPKDWQGFAFGLGVDRLAMMKYKINDIRLFYSGDLRFLHQF